MYERKDAENKAYLMRVFGAELARVRDNYLSNKKHTETLVKTQYASLQVLIKQELKLAGVESEFDLRRVSLIRYGENKTLPTLNELEKIIINKDLEEE